MLKEFLNLLFPKICFACGDAITGGIQSICISCRNSLPRTNFHKQKVNPIEKLFWGRLEIEKATAYLKFEKRNKTQRLLHHLKYRGIKEVGSSLGEMAALEIQPNGFFDDIDLLVPIPIHKVKERKRGYNQSFYIAQGISSITNIAVDITSITKNINSESQTKKSRFKRYENVTDTFLLTESSTLSGKHLLLIDDVITTGATIEACGNVLKSIPNVRISILTIAYTY